MAGRVSFGYDWGKGGLPLPSLSTVRVGGVPWSSGTPWSPPPPPSSRPYGKREGSFLLGHGRDTTEQRTGKERKEGDG